MKFHAKTTTAVALVTSLAFAGGAAAATGGTTTGAQADHCLRGFTMVDANNDGKVSKQEADMIVSQEFGAIDSNGDGSISQSEYDECQRAADYYRDMPASVAQNGDQAFEAADTNKDQKVDRQEYMKGAQQAYDSAQSSGMESGSEPVAVLHRYIWVVAPESSESEQGSQEPQQDMSKDEAAGHAASSFSALDSNGDDTLTKQEWQGSGQQGAGQKSSSTDKKFSSVDSDGNGKISKEEYKSARDKNFSDAQSAAQSSGSGTQSSSSGSQQSSSSGSQSGSSQTSSSAQSSSSGDAVPVFYYRIYYL